MNLKGLVMSTEMDFDILVVSTICKLGLKFFWTEYGFGQLIFGQSNWLGELSDTDLFKH